jgi:hypothetical protein
MSPSGIASTSMISVGRGRRAGIVRAKFNGSSINAGLGGGMLSGVSGRWNYEDNGGAAG